MSTKPRGTENSSATKQQLIAEADAGSLSRAQQNDYEFALAGESHVNVRNTNYDETGHVYTVSVENGLPARCTCPADEHHSGPCKHRLACAIRAPIMQAIGAPVRDVTADGGVEPSPDADTPTTPYTTHIEPADQGGERYARCTGCAREILPVGRFDKLLHADGCPVGEERQ